MTENTIAAGEFKAKCLKLMADIERTSTPLIITKRGKPLVKIIPYVADDAPESAFGCMQGSALLQEHNVDISNNASITKDAVTESPIKDTASASTSIELDDFLEDDATHEPEEIEAKIEQDVAPTEVEKPKEIKKPLPISRTAPPNRGLPIDTAHRQHKEQNTVSTPTAQPKQEESEDEIYIPSFEADTTEAIETNIPYKDEAEQVYASVPEDRDGDDDFAFEDDEFFFFDDEDEEGESSYEPNNTPRSATSSEDVKAELTKQFTSAWNRKPSQGDKS